MTVAPAPSAAPPAPPLPLRQGWPYFAAAVIVGLSQGLGQGFVSANIPQFAGDLGVTTTEASWLMAAYMIPRASLPLMLVKIRTQFGLRRFAEVGIVLYALVAFASLWISDLRSAVVVQFLSGVASAPLSTLGFLYMLEPLSPQNKMRIGIPMVMAVLMGAPNLARVISPALIGDGGLWSVHLTTLGLALVSIALVYLLPLRPVPHQKVIERMDFLSFGLLAFGLGGLTVAVIMGPIHWWTDAPWIGLLMAASVASLAAALVVELNRKAPLVDFRWLASPAMLHLAVTLFLFRLILSEQSTGAPRLFQVLGLAPSQLTGLFAVILGAGILGALACVPWIRADRAPQFHFVALALIALGAFLDSHATALTRPEQMIVSQALIGFAAILFLPPSLILGLMAALQKGPNYILSFIIVFLTTQSLGGVAGSGIFTTFINYRQAFHLQTLTEQMSATDPQLVSAIARGAAGLASQSTDAGALRAQAVSGLAQQASTQAYVMAYNDAYFLICLVALGAMALLLLHLLRDRLALWLARPAPSEAETPVQEAAT
ncbi:MFS transporter [Cereibacter sphaeroides]|uniref:MFS transporter n=1 Tax=Cereibacter sphaeroides TaxID=1063 RepID=UPI000F5316FC|nr:MFS transporter [Cereibacter sphaeroides]AZB57739.1 MFS transporter [Cereibacter sphaeroides]